MNWKAWTLASAALTLGAGCTPRTLTPPDPAPAGWSAEVSPKTRAPKTLAPQDAFWENLTALCGKSFEGRVAAKVGGGPGPDPFETERLVMHVRECSRDAIRVPFHVGADRSRTWVFTRTAAGLRLKHDHRHADGKEDDVNMYGGDTAEPGTPERQSFPADAYSRELFVRAEIPQSVANVWVAGLVPGLTFSYGLQRPGRDFRVDFDLTRPVLAPPPPWGTR